MLLLVLYVLVPSIHSFFDVTATLLKSDVFWHSEAYSSQFSSYRYWTGFIVCEEETGALGLPINWQQKKLSQIFKVGCFALKKCALFKKFLKISYSFFFFKKRSFGIRIYVLNALTTSNFLYL